MCVCTHLPAFFNKPEKKKKTRSEAGAGDTMWPLLHGAGPSVAMLGGSAERGRGIGHESSRNPSPPLQFPQYLPYDHLEGTPKNIHIDLMAAWRPKDLQEARQKIYHNLISFNTNLCHMQRENKIYSFSEEQPLH